MTSLWQRSHGSWGEGWGNFLARTSAPRLTGLLLIVLGACKASPPVPVSTAPGTDNPDTGGTEQAETSVVQAMTGSDTGMNSVVVAYNDWTVWRQGDPQLQPEFSYDPKFEHLTIKYGASLAGYSVSLDGGASFEYGGKIRPPQGWAHLAGDPKLAVDPTNQRVVYLVNMGVSDERWTSVTGLPAEPGQAATDAPLSADGFCVARSLDGGQSFKEIHCEQVGEVDQTGIAVDGTGRVWVAYDDTSGLMAEWHTRVWRSEPHTWSIFKPIDPVDENLGQPPNPGPISAKITPNERRPRLVTDDAGDVYLGTFYWATIVGDHLGDLWAFRGFNVAQDTWYSYTWVTTSSADCQTPSYDSLDILFPTLPSGRSITNAFGYDFKVGYDEGGNKILRAVIPTDPGHQQQLHLGVADTRFSPNGQADPTLCRVTDATGRLSPGQQFQPTIHYYDDPNATSSSGERWWLAYMTTWDVPDPKENYIRLEAWRLQSGGAMSTRTLLTDRDWFACTRLSGYWGDYFGITMVERDGTPKMLAALPSARYNEQVAPPCTTETMAFASPLHVVAVKW